MKNAYRFFPAFLLFFCSCTIPFEWQNDIQGFVEDGYSAVLLRDFSFDAPGIQSEMVPSGAETVVTASIINPRNLSISYTVEWDDTAAVLFDIPPAVIDSGSDSAVISFTPSLSAERADISFSLGFSAPDLNRDYAPGTITVRCNSAPNAAADLRAFFDGSDRSWLRFGVPVGAADDDLESAEIVFFPVDESLAERTEQISLSGVAGPVDFHPSGVASGVPYRYRVSITDTEGLVSETVQTANGDVYQVTYSDNGADGGIVPTDGSFYLEGDTVTVSGNTGVLVLTGYSFNGWNTEPGGGGTAYAAGATFSMPAGAVTLYAQWAVNSYTLSYDGNGSDGGTAPANGDHPFGSTVTVSGNTGALTLTGYSFNGWNTEPGGGGTAYAAGATFSMPAAAMTLYAQWSINSYTLSYNANSATGGSVPSSTVNVYNSAVIVSTNSGSLVRTSYVFDGWNTASDGTGTAYAEGAPLTMPPNDLVLYARWIPVYALIYDGNGATGGTPPATVEYLEASGVTISYSSDLANSGYVFSHWNTAANNSGTTWYPDDAYTMPAYNVTLYAIWVAGTDYAPGDAGPSAGFIFYDKGYYRDGWRFLEAASADIGLIYEWGVYDTAIGSTATAIGAGKENTDLIVATAGHGTGSGFPAAECDAYSAGGFDDWYLPSYEEVVLIYNELYLNGIGGLINSYYWSSTEMPPNQARAYYYNTGGGYILSKNQTADSTYVRPVRRF